MANLSSHLFQVIDDEPIFCAIQINIPCFKELYLQDDTPDKSTYRKQLAFIWYLQDSNSPYYNAENKREECAKAAFGTTKIKITKSLQDCIDEYTLRQSTPESRALDTIKSVMEGMLKSLNNRRESDSQEDNRYLTDLDDQIRKENDVKLRRTLLLMKDERISKMNENNLAIINQIPKIANVIKDMVELRKVVAQSMLEIDSSTNKENIANHIIYDIIDLYRGYNKS